MDSSPNQPQLGRGNMSHRVREGETYPAGLGRGERSLVRLG